MSSESLASGYKPRSKKGKFVGLFVCLALFCVYWVWESITPHLPKASAPAKLYSNQCQQDLRLVLLSALARAQHSVYLVMFGLTDPAILTALSQKIKEGSHTKIYYDVDGSAAISKHLPGCELHPIQNSALMHQKILILDREMVFIGSANMTTASLRMHDNLVIGLVSRTVAEFLENHEPFTSGFLHTQVGGQDLALWLLPDPRGHAVIELRKKIRSASRSVRVALFTFTHSGLIDELIAAHQRGVPVSVVVDLYSAYGASAKAIDQLKKAGVPVRVSQGPELLHHKFIYIDEETLFTGSANWTKAAFYKNSDCILSLSPLNREQIRFMNRLWHVVQTATK